MKNLLTCFVVLAGLGMPIAAVHAQTGSPPSHQETAPAPNVALPSGVPAPPAGPLPIVDAAKELKGAALVEALRKGGFVLYMRHTQTGSLAEKCDESSLSAVGQKDARTVGTALRELKIPIGTVLSSQPCRANVTASMLGVGASEMTEDLNPVPPKPGFDIGAARTKRLNEIPKAGTNTLLVSHLHGSRNRAEWIHLELGEIIVFRPDSDSSAAAIARVRIEGWAELVNAIALATQRR